MNHWLLKSEPSTFGIDDLERAPRKTTSWDGIRNYQARNFIRDQLHKGDEAFLYHSSCEQPGIVGVLRVSRGPYPDASAFDRKNKHFDEGSDAENPRWYAFDVQLQRRLPHIITLDELRAFAQTKLKDLIVLRAGNRLSISPVSEAHWRFILALK